MGDFKIFQDSDVNASWATISISDEVGSCEGDVEESLDDTLPIEEVEDLGVKNNFSARHHDNKYSYQSVNMLPNRAISALGVSPAAPKDIKDFQPVQCSSAIQLDSAGSSGDSTSFEFSPKYCSSKMDNRHKRNLRQGSSLKNKDTQPNLFVKQPPPIIREIAKLKPHLGSPYNLKIGMGSEEFKPERCSTALSESEFKIPSFPTGLLESSAFFAPLRCSTGLIRSASMNHPPPSAQADFIPHRCSTGVQDNSTVFIPLRCSTEKNESAIFNPILSSTATKSDESNIPEFKYLRMDSGNPS